MDHSFHIRALSHHDAVRDLRGGLTVQATFPRAVHLRHSAARILTVTTTPYNGPLGVRVHGTSLEHLPVRPGMQAHLDDDEIRIELVHISLVQSSPWPGPVPRPASPVSPTALKRDVDSLMPVATFPPGVSGTIDSFVDAIVAENGPSLEQHVLRVMGLGSGLTPAGDDLLCGLLAGIAILGARSLDAMWAEGVVQRLRLAIEPHAPARTTSLSQTLLYYAAQAVAVEPLLDVLYTMGGNGPIAGLDSLLTIGHTSGRDMLAGAILAARAVMEKGGANGASLVYPA